MKTKEPTLHILHNSGWAEGGALSSNDAVEPLAFPDSGTKKDSWDDNPDLTNRVMNRPVKPDNEVAPLQLPWERECTDC